jgi:hypothetical protein
MQAIGASFSHAPELNTFLPQEGYHGVTRASLLNASSRKSTDISLVTAEGDKVTISAKSALQAGLVSYDYRGRLNGNEVSLQGRSLQISSENALAISVEGDLSKEELADIKKLVGKIEKLGSDLFSRPLDETLSRAVELGDDLDSIASFEANLSISQQLTVARQVTEEFAPAEAPPAPAPVPTQNSTPTPEPANAQPISVGNVKSFINTLLKDSQDARGEAEKIAEKLPKFLNKFFKQLAREFDFDLPKQRLADHIQQKVGRGLKALAEHTPVAAAA